MPKSLSIDNPLDGNLKPVKDLDGTLSALELSTETIRVKNLEVSGTTTGISAGSSVTVDSSLTDGSTNPVENNAVYDGLATKLALAGGTMTGDIAMSDAGITGAKEITLADGEDGLSFDGGSNYITSFKDEDNMSSNNASAICSQQSIKAYVDTSLLTHRWILNSGFNYSYTAGTKIYLPLNGYILESSSSSGRNEYQVVVAPYDGYLEKVIVRSEGACGSSIVGLHISGDNTEIPAATAAHTVTVNMAVDDVGYNFVFGDSASFSKGNALAVSFDPTNDANDTIAVAVFILDGST